MDRKKIDPIIWQQLNQLLEQALELDGLERAGFIQQAPAELREQLSDLLERSGTHSLDQLVFRTIKSTAWDLPESDPLKAEIERWKLRRELGSGGMAQVFYAERHEHDYIQRAAIKILWPYRADHRFQQRFVRERGILASMEHPNIARFLDGGVLADGRPWLAMEFVDGVSITEYCQRQDLGIRDRLKLFLQVCDAVEYSHEKLIVHRDIKPQNILVDMGGHALLLDFGIAQDFDALDMEATNDNMVTLQYASPEQIKGEQANVASDVYQLGLLLYELLAGRQPAALNALPIADAIDTICNKQPAAPSTHNPKVSRDLDAVIARALSKDPTRRYRSAAYLANDVQNVLSEKPVRARPSTRAYRARLFIRRNRVVVFVTSIAVVGLLIAILFTLKFANDAQTEANNSAVTQRIMLDIFKQADPLSGPGEVTLSSALVNALPNLKEKLADTPELRYPVFSNFADLLIGVGKYNLAMEAMEEAFSAVSERSLSDPERLSIVAAMTRLQVSRGQYNEALLLANQQGVKTATPDNALAQVLMWTPLIEAYRQQGDLDNGTVVVARVARIIDDHNITDLDALGKFYNLRSLLATSLGDLESAERYGRAAADYARQDGNLREQSVLLHNLAINLGRQGRYDESEVLFLESLDITNTRTSDHPLHAHHLANYAGLLYRTKRVDEALAALDNAIGVLETSSQPAWLARAWRSKAAYADGTGRFEMAVPAMVTYYQLNVDTFGVGSRQHMESQFQLARLGHLLGFQQFPKEWLSEVASLNPTIAIGDTNLEMAQMLLESGDYEQIPAYLARIPDDYVGRKLEIHLRYACAMADHAAIKNTLKQIEMLNSSTTGSNEARLWALYVAWRLASQDAHDPVTFQAFMGALQTEYPKLQAQNGWRLLQAAKDSAEPHTQLPIALEAEWNRLDQSRTAAHMLFPAELERLSDYANIPASSSDLALAIKPLVSCL